MMLQLTYRDPPMLSQNSSRTISLPASLVEDVIRLQAGELERLKQQLAEAQERNGTIPTELIDSVESTVKIISDLDEALRRSQDPSAESTTSRSKLSTPSLISVPSVIRSEGYEYIDNRSEPFTDANYSQSGRSKVSSASSSPSGDSETSTMDSIATRPLKPFSYKPWPQDHIKMLRQQGVLSQPSFYPGDELVIDFDNRRQAHLITVMHTLNNSQRTKKLHAWFEEFALKGWSGALMVRHEQAWYYAGTYRTTGYVKLSGEEFQELPEGTKRPIYVQAVHAIQVPKTGGTNKKDSRSVSKKSTNPASSSRSRAKNDSSSGSAVQVPTRTDVQAWIAEGRMEVAKITFHLVSFDKRIGKALINLPV
ncbi:hypothetical protein D9757_010616 [Collybiopsis confluens]|uniref:DUF6697 domain-containing protein n=1 Tax=Collybiopsis confluens TaxID=2823264 RepID=A0A8H5GRY3_9AGAR|nr:hypothetical protein D9757_012835 [Collybiopsis confluens]KAF5370173.1 hypothetical protein D9757_010616 [Collybiopsis confluens]